LAAFLTRLIDKSCAIRMSGGQVSSCQRAYTRAPPFGVGDTRACFSSRIAKDGRHDPDINSLRQCHAMLRPRTLVRGNEIFGKTERPAPLVTHGSASTFRLQGNVSGHCRLLGALYRSLAFEYFARRLIRSVCPDSARKRSPTFWHQGNAGGFSRPMADAPVAMNRDQNPLAR